MDSLVPQIVENFKAAYGLKISDNADLFLVERNLLEFLMKLGRELMSTVFQGMENGYEGAVMSREGRKYKFVGYRKTSLHGLFGMIDYKRAYYFSEQHGGGATFPWRRNWESRNGTPRAVSTFWLHSPGGKPIRRAWKGFTKSSAPTRHS